MPYDDMMDKGYSSDCQTGPFFLYCTVDEAMFVIDERDLEGSEQILAVVTDGKDIIET